MVQHDIWAESTMWATQGYLRVISNPTGIPSVELSNRPIGESASWQLGSL